MPASVMRNAGNQATAAAIHGGAFDSSEYTTTVMAEKSAIPTAAKVERCRRRRAILLTVTSVLQPRRWSS
jgi:poly(3-hydroxybutyrate) depolymerase